MNSPAPINSPGSPRCPDCGGEIHPGDDQFADSWICGACLKTVSVPKLNSPKDLTRKVLLDVADGPEGITIYTSEDRAVVDFAEQCPALYLSASLNDAHVNLGPFTLLRDPVIAALGRNSTVPFGALRPLGSDWTHESAMRVHSAVVIALEELGWHPCPAIKAAWTALAAITTEYHLQELPDDEEIGPKTHQS